MISRNVIEKLTFLKLGKWIINEFTCCFYSEGMVARREINTYKKNDFLLKVLTPVREHFKVPNKIEKKKWNCLKI